MVVLLKPRTIDTTGADDTNRVLQWDPVTHELHYAPATIGVSYMGTAVAAHADSVDFIGDGVAVTMVGDQLTVNVPKTDLSKAPGKFRGEWTDASLFKTYTFSDGTIPPEFLLEHGDVATNPLVVAATVDVYTKVVQLSINKGNTYDWSKMSLTLSALNVFGIVKAKFWTYNDGGFNAASVRTQVLKNGTTLISRTGGYGWTEDTVACTENDVLAWQAIGTGDNITVNARSQVAGIRFYATTDPYLLGHFVAYQGMLWKSNTDNNSSVPGADGNWSPVVVAGRPVTASTGTAYTLAATDLERTVTLTNAAATTLTIPTNATVAGFPVGATVELLNLGAGVVTITGASGVTVTSEATATLTLKRYQRATLTKVAADSWVVTKEHQGAVATLTDVDLSTSPTDKQVLAFDAASGRWKPGTATPGSGATALSGLSDVDLSTAPTDGQALAFNVASGKWKPGSVAAGGGSGGGALLKVAAYNTSTKYTTTSTVDVDIDATNLAVTFTTPPSGTVLVKVSSSAQWGNAATGAFDWLLREGATTVSAVSMGPATVYSRKHGEFLITGLVPGSTHTYKWGWKVYGTGTATMWVGGAEGVKGPGLMEVYDAGGQ